MLSIGFWDACKQDKGAVLFHLGVFDLMSSDFLWLGFPFDAATNVMEKALNVCPDPTVNFPSKEYSSSSGSSSVSSSNALEHFRHLKQSIFHHAFGMMNE